MLQQLDLPRRARAAGIHLLISAAVAALAAALVFGVWYPGIYRVLAGGRDLFLLIMAVDVVLGPLLTFAVFSVKKGWPHLRRDLAIIGLIQLAALVYGLYTVYGARPVATVFEVDRFKVVTAAQVHLPELPKAPAGYQTLPLSGPWLLGSRKPSGGGESNDALFMAIENGIDRAQRPLFWTSYADSIPEVLARARPVALLLEKRPELAADVRRALQDLKLSEAEAKFLPIMGRGGDWVVLIDPKGQLVHYVQADGFF
ncbi:MAG: hypothetical protein RIS44_2681 [Pseudomonadota bacterium]|jgi:hypothetical protein